MAGQISPPFLFLGLSVCLITLLAQPAYSQSNSSDEDVKPDRCAAETGCRPELEGLIVPLWKPLETNLVDKIARGLVYFLVLSYLFLGVSIVADRFMSAIEMITSQEREVVVKRPNGEETVVTVRIWNETVSNLTLMALGSSAPEILLSIIEIIAKDFKAGDLGPGTIVGSAAFNLFCIIAICVYVIPDDEVRKIEHLRVFVVTATWSILAYLWLYFIIAISSVGRVDVWEAMLTFAFFPILVALAYITDRKIFFMKFLEKKYIAQSAYNKKANDIEMQSDKLPNATNHVLGSRSTLDDDLDPNANQKREFMKKLHELRTKNPDMPEEKLEQLAAYEVVQSQHKSRAYYRIMATRKMTGAGNVLKRNIEKKVHDDKSHVEKDKRTRVYFDPGEYTVMENVGSFEVDVVRTGMGLDFYTIVDFETIDGSAMQGSDFHFAQGSIRFAPGEKVATVTLHIVDDDEFEEDEHFKLRLHNLRNTKSPSQRMESDSSITCILGELGDGQDELECQITILDDDHCGVFSFEQEEITVSENCGEAKIKVCRNSGARGNVHVPYMTISGKAKGGGVDYLDSFGDLEFKNDETFKYISVKIIDDEDYEKDNEYFFLEIGHPKKVASIDNNGRTIYDEDFSLDEEKMSDNQIIAMQGRPKLGIVSKCRINITESQEFKGAVDRLMNNTNMGGLLGTSSWKEQFREALTVSAGDDDEGDDEKEEGEEEEGESGGKQPGCLDYIMHFLTVPWKLLFAFIPPTDIMGGWACFVFSIGGIGLLTALIGDLASHFGCTVGLKDTVTAISFVALGTSVPDTFASKTAAVGDQNADASVGNVTGSNAVNVFLGIGIAWSMAAIYHAVKGTPGGFAVEPGTLGFSVTTFCILALVCIAILMVRRYYKPIGAELGGPPIAKTITSIILVGLWISYIILSALVAYCIIEGF
ncbi:sodium/calcium exchanger 1-like isoform X2 [Convolutriloba macropyga]|uniref:sodium/calcium exchanger 1-like isoform X2 n=1 Tax=Convolutriloba macropyga TaxID=536237 RepID=UPI003F527CD5